MTDLLLSVGTAAGEQETSGKQIIIISTYICGLTTGSVVRLLRFSPSMARKETQRKIIMYRSEHKAEASLPNKHCFLMLKEIKYKSLTDCNRILIFTSEFSFLSRKISAYLRTDSSSGANTQKISGYRNILNINYLCLNGISSLCKKHHFGLRNRPFRRPKSTISHANMGYFA